MRQASFGLLSLTVRRSYSDFHGQNAMTDSRLQHLKRAWETSGSVEDEAAYLRERVRAGDLSQNCLLLAATVGHVAAQWCCLGVNEEPLLCDLCFRITDWGREAATRMGVASTNFLLSQWKWPHPGTDPQRVLTATEEWVLSPTEAFRERAKAIAENLREAINLAEGDPDVGFVIHHTTHSRAASTAVSVALAAVATTFGDEERSAVVRAVTDAQEVCEAQHEIRAAICSELGAWALGYDDPLLARAQGLRGEVE